MSGCYNERPHPELCSCPSLGVTGLDELEDLLRAGFGPQEAGWMLWLWSRDEVAGHLAAHAPR